jgi:catechol 2,3-dioxygenase-like lactoylglutathione lyase family enzyme
MPLVPGRRTPFLHLALLALTAIVAPALQAQEPTPPPFAGIAHVAIRVKNLADSIAFYNKLGFEQAFDLRKNDVPYESFIKVNDHQFIELYPVDDKNPTPAFLHVCFEGIDLNAIHDDYIARGLTPTAVRKAGAGNLLFTMKGPEDGAGTPQNIEYTQYQPGSLHSNDQGKHLGSDRVADTLFAATIGTKDPAAARDFYLNQLEFKSISGDPMFLHMPGNSGQEIEIASYSTLTTRARLTLRTPNLSRAARELHKQDIQFTKSADTLTVTDPDGNLIMIREE